MNTLSNFLTIGLLLIWSIGLRADITTTYQPYQCGDVAKIDENALVISVPSQQLLYVPSQDKLYDLAQVRRCDPRALHRFHKVAVLDTQTGEPTKLVEWNQNNQFNYAQWQLGIGAESRAVEEMVIYAKTLQKIAETIKADDPQQKVNLWPWHVPYSGISKQLLAWLAELEPKALVVLTAGSYRGLSTIGELSTTRSFTSWEDRYSLEINNRICADGEQVPLTTLFGTHQLLFEVHWRGENLFETKTQLEDTAQLSFPLWFLHDSDLKSEITLTPQETEALKAPLQLIELNTQAAGQLTFKVRQEYIKPTVRYPDDAPVNWTTLCPIKEELAQTWINYLVNSARLVCPYLDRQNQVKLELIGDGIHVDTRQLLLSLDFTLDDSYTNPKDWRIAGALSHLQSNNQRVWKILASDLSVGQCSLTFEPISAEATLAFTSTPAKMSDEICQRLYKPDCSRGQRGLKPWPKGQPEKMGHSFEIKVKPTPRLLQTHLPQDSLWRKMHWLLNNKHKCQMNENGYFDCESGNNISFLDLLGGK